MLTSAVTEMKFAGFGVASVAVSMKVEPFDPDCTVSAAPELVVALVIVQPPDGPEKLYVSPPTSIHVLSLVPIGMRCGLQKVNETVLLDGEIMSVV